MKTLIKNAQVVLPTGVESVSVLLADGKIAAIDAAIQVTADATIDAAGLHLLPGIIDDQVHFREPGLTHKEDLAAASRACAKGGVTTFLEMPNTKPAAITQALVDDKYALAAKSSLVNYGFYIGATPENIADLKAATNVPGIKIFIGSSTGDLLVDDQDALERIFAETTLPITAHCEDESTVRANAALLAGTTDVTDHSRIRDHEAAIVATRRAFDLAKRHQHRFHLLHVTTGAETELLRRSPGASHRRGLFASPHVYCGRLRSTGYAAASQPFGKNQARPGAALAGARRKSDSGDCDRPRAAYVGRKAAGLSQLSLGNALDRKQFGTDA